MAQRLTSRPWTASRAAHARAISARSAGPEVWRMSRRASSPSIGSRPGGRTGELVGWRASSRMSGEDTRRETLVNHDPGMELTSPRHGAVLRLSDDFPVRGGGSPCRGARSAGRRRMPPRRACAYLSRREGGGMLWTITILLVVLWALGMVSGSALGAWVHILL